MQMPRRLTNPFEAMKNRRSPRGLLTLRLVFAALAIMLVGAGCAKARLPDSDSTPPALYWVVVDGETGERTETRADEPYAQVKVNGHAVITLVAKDTGGVSRIRLYDPSVSYTCKSGNIASTTGPGLGSGSYDEQKLQPDAKNVVLTEIILLDTAYFTATCDPGWSLSSQSYHYSGEAENYYGGVTTSKLQVVYVP